MVKEILTDFCDETSAQGFKGAVNGKSVFDRVLWALCTLAAWCAMLFYGIDMITAYLSYPTNTIVTLQYDHQNGFPAVTVCNMNPMPYSKVKLIAQVNDPLLDDLRRMVAVLNESEEAVSWQDTQQSTPSKAINASTDDRLKRMVEANLFKLGNEVLGEYGHQIGDMLLECTYQGFQCYPENFTQWQHGQYGNCYTMFINPNDYPTSLTGPQFGLQMQLYVQSKEYLPRAVSRSGFRVAIHQPNETAYPEETGFTISPGTFASVSLKQLTISRKPLPWDGTDCLTDDDKRVSNLVVLENMAKLLAMKGYAIDKMDYTFAACLKSCYQRLAVEQCGCVDAASITEFLASEDSTLKDRLPCDLGIMKSQEDRTCLVENVQPNASDKCGTECLQPCNQVQYISRVSSSLWPNNDYIKLAMHKWSTRIPDVTQTILELTPAGLLQDSELGTILESAGAIVCSKKRRKRGLLGGVGSLLSGLGSALGGGSSGGVVGGVVGGVTNVTSGLINATTNLTNQVVDTGCQLAGRRKRSLLGGVSGGSLIAPVGTVTANTTGSTGNTVPDGSIPDATSTITNTDTSGVPKEVIRALGDFYVQNLLRGELVGIEIFFEELNVESITEEAQWQLFDLMSNTGGMFGLFIGITFLTAVEVVILIKDLTCHAFKKHNKPNVSASNNDRLSDSWASSRRVSTVPSHLSLAYDSPRDGLPSKPHGLHSQVEEGRKISVESYSKMAPPTVST